MPPAAGEDAETHVRRIAEIAWKNSYTPEEAEIIAMMERNNIHLSMTAACTLINDIRSMHKLTA